SAPAALPESAPVAIPKSAPAALPESAPVAIPKSAPAAHRESSLHKFWHRHVRAKPAPKQEETKEKKAIPPKDSTLVFRIMPWGEVYVDGKKMGASPPLKSLKIGPGKHQIEIMNSNLPSHSQSVETKPGERVIIEHNF
ncbi:MAG TPA: hypothetical protein PLK99_02310, partial [Burkholderiales bacterium]|nr:hypothetical protein [Burkholderiales bacterium]